MIGWAGGNEHLHFLQLYNLDKQSPNTSYLSECRNRPPTFCKFCMGTKIPQGTCAAGSHIHILQTWQGGGAPRGLHTRGPDWPDPAAAEHPGHQTPHHAGEGHSPAMTHLISC